MPRLSDSEIAERTRAANRRRSERQRQRLANAGKVALMVWVDAGLQKQIAGIAADESSTTSAVAERLFIAGINALAEPARPAEPVDASPEPTPADTDPFNQDLAAFKAAVIDAWNAGITGYGPIATELTRRGFRNSNRNLYTREAVKRTLVKAGLVTETNKEAQL